MSTHSKVAVITGAAQGIGAALVNAYLAIGYRVVANSRSIAASTDPNLLTVAGDIGDPEVGRRVIGEGFDAFGRIDTLVNNAGVFAVKPFTEFTSEDWTETISTNLA